MVGRVLPKHETRVRFPSPVLRKSEALPAGFLIFTFPLRFSHSQPRLTLDKRGNFV